MKLVNSTFTYVIEREEEQETEKRRPSFQKKRRSYPVILRAEDEVFI